MASGISVRLFCREKAADLIVAVAALIGAIYFLVARDVVLWGNGYGFDGWIYGEITEHLPENISSGRISRYFGCRILPCVACRGLLAMCNLEPTRDNIIFGFRMLNAFVMMVGSVLWLRICRRLNISEVMKIAGWLTLFFSFFIGKTLAYHPVLTDGFALLFSLIMIVCCLERSVVGLAVVTLFASFTWPLAGYFGSLLICLAKIVARPNISPYHRVFPSKLFFGFVMCLTLIVALSFIWCGWSPEARVKGLRVGTLRSVLVHSPNIFLWVYAIRSVVLDCGFLLLARDVVSIRNLGSLFLAASVVALHWVVLSSFTNSELLGPSYGYSPLELLYNARGGDGQILSTFAAHISLAGPLVSCAAVAWPLVSKSAAGLGGCFSLGLVCCITAWLQTETRFAMLCFPFAVCATCQGLTPRRMNVPVIIVFLIFWFYFSGIWRTINPSLLGAGVFTIIDARMPDSWNASAFEYIRLCGMFRGQTWPDYVWNLFTAGCCFYAVYLTLRPVILEVQCSEVR